jgi:hypothetical protein
MSLSAVSQRRLRGACQKARCAQVGEYLAGICSVARVGACSQCRHLPVQTSGTAWTWSVNTSKSMIVPKGARVADPPRSCWPSARCWRQMWRGSLSVRVRSAGLISHSLAAHHWSSAACCVYNASGPRTGSKGQLEAIGKSRSGTCPPYNSTMRAKSVHVQ